jgi:hypothetical protein
MTVSLKIFIIPVLLLFAGAIVAKGSPAQADTLKGKAGQRESVTDSRNTNPKSGDAKKDKSSGNPNSAVKQIKSARPDMSRARGARPPDIVRPSGSRIPRGVGRPAGAGRHGRG